MARRQPPPEKHGAAASRIYDGTPLRQPELPHASQKGEKQRGSGVYHHLCSLNLLILTAHAPDSM